MFNIEISKFASSFQLRSIPNTFCFISVIEDFKINEIELFYPLTFTVGFTLYSLFDYYYQF